MMSETTEGRTGRCEKSKDEILRLEDNERRNSSPDRDRERNIINI
jgi:hypothetical protein